MTRWVLDFISATGYFGIVALMFIENVFPPIPSEFIMPLAGFMAMQNKFSLTGIIAAGTLGSVLGALPLYFTGAKIGEERIKNFADRRGKWLALSRRDIERANHWFEKHGAAAVFFCRLIPGVRSLISIPAGVNRMNLASFVFFTTLGSAVWSAILAYAGYFLGSNFREIEKYLDFFLYAVLAVVVFLYVFRLFRGENRFESGSGRRNRA